MSHLQFNGTGIVINGGDATITNTIGSIQFLNASTAGSATINNAGILSFFNTSTAGNAIITNSVSGSLTFSDNSSAGNAFITDSGNVNFSNNSSAGNATIANNSFNMNFRNFSTAANASITNNGTLNFFNTSTAGNASITNTSILNFNDTSTAGSARITNTSILNFTDTSTAGNATINHNNGFLDFNNNSTAGSAAITNNDALNFNDSSTAGNATITNNDNLNFNNTSTAGNAAITNAAFGSIDFVNSSTAGNAIITNNSNVFFDGNSTAENATITNNHNVFFSGNSTAGNAAITNTGNGVVDFSGSTGPAGDRKLTAGSIAGAGSFVLGANELTVSGNNLSTEVSGVISGVLGSLVKAGTGTLTLSGTNTYFGPTTVNAGALIVNGSITPSVLTTVNAGGTLGGNGTVGNTVVNAGGTLASGPVGRPGFMTITGDLTLQPGAFYTVQIIPPAASNTNVSGTASLAGTVTATFAPGSFLTRSYTILTAAGGRNGTFDAFTTVGLPADFQASVSYPGNTAVLNLIADLVPEPIPPTTTPPTPTPPTPSPAQPLVLPINQSNVGHAIDNFFNNGGALPPAFLPLFGLSGGNLSNALSQLSGEPATGAEKVAFQLTDQFLNMMLDPFVDGRGGSSGAGLPAPGFAPEAQALPPELARAYTSVFKARPGATPSYDPRWTAWGGAYGGSNRTNGDAAVVGSHDFSGRTFGFAAGLDYRLTPDTVVGVALAGAGADWSLSQGLGGGRSDAFQAGVYGSTRYGPAYVAAAFALANYWMSTDRVAVGDHLTANFNAQSYGGRLEGGYRLGLPSGGVTPYAAIQAQSFHMPGFNETGAITNGFALAFASHDATDTRSELGARFDRAVALNSDAVLVLRGRIAWAHDWVTSPSLAPTFQALPGAGFIVYGATPAKDSALASAGAELRLSKGLSLLAKFDGEFASGSRTYAGTGTLRYAW